MALQSQISAGAFESVLAELNEELAKVVGLSTSVRSIGLDLPPTVPESDSTLCPELVFPSLAAGLLMHANKSLLLVERITDLLREQSSKSEGCPHSA